MNAKLKNDMAKIAINKSLLKEFTNSSGDRIVYMDDGTEFQIQLYNSEKDDIGILIYINNTPLTNYIILHPAQRLWLERYLDKEVKFKFTTYTIDGDAETREIIADNGVVKVEFYRKQQKLLEPVQIVTDSPWIDKPWKNRIWYEYSIDNKIDNSLNTTPNTYYCDTSISDNTNRSFINNIVSTSDCCIKGSNLDLAQNLSTSSLNFSLSSFKEDTIETGRIDEGSHSNQKFRDINIDLEYLPFKTEVIKILPTSRKPVYANDLKKQYCSNCGHKLNQKYKFCPYCATKID